MTIQKVFGLLKQLGQSGEEERRNVVYHFTQGRTTSLRALTDLELHELSRSLALQVVQQPRSKEVQSADTMRKAILRMAHEMEWELPGTTRVDMERVNAWCIKYGHLHKKLNAYKYAELPRLVSQFEKVYEDYLKGVTKECN
jgi:hypothetical protein